MLFFQYIIDNRELKIRRRRVSATAAMTVENWGEAAVVRREK